MPRLLVFAACQRPTVDREDNALSLIAIMGGVIAYVPAEEPIAPDTIIPIRWGAAAYWLKEAGDEGRTFAQRVDIVLPNGDVVGGGGNVTFTMTNRTHHSSIRADGFPVGQPGECQLRLSLRDVDAGGDWEIISEYPMEVQHAPAPVEPPPSVSED